MPFPAAVELLGQENICCCVLCSVKKLVHSRCYVNFAEPGAIPAFKGAIEAHAFVTERGAQYRGCVEYAPFQKIPDARVKRDPREGTLESGEAAGLAQAQHAACKPVGIAA